ADGGAAPAVDAGVPSQIPTNAFSLVPLGANLPAEIEETDVPPQAVALSAAGDRVLITERDDTKKVYGAQKNAEGRITFVALDSGQARTLTGFEIGAGIVDWAQGSTPATDGGTGP